MADVTEREALARVIRSESGSYTEPEREAIGWLTRNRAIYAKKTIAQLVCNPTCGHGGHGRWASSAQTPTAADLALADKILTSPQSADPTYGAIDSFEPALQDKLLARGDGGYHLSADQVRQQWLKSYDLYEVVGHWELYGLKGKKGLPPSAKRSKMTPLRVAMLTTGAGGAVGLIIGAIFGRAR